MNCGDCKYGKNMEPQLAKGGPSGNIMTCHRRSLRVPFAWPETRSYELCGEWERHNPEGEFERALAGAP